MKRNYPKILRNRKRRIQRRLDPERGWSDQREPIMKASNMLGAFEIAAGAFGYELLNAIAGAITALEPVANALGFGDELTGTISTLNAI